MVISISKSLQQKSLSNAELKMNECEISEYVQKTIEDMGDNEEVIWIENKRLQLQSGDDIKLHSLVLKMEELGLSIRMTKQTVIEIS